MIDDNELKKLIKSGGIDFLLCNTEPLKDIIKNQQVVEALENYRKAKDNLNNVLENNLEIIHN